MNGLPDRCQTLESLIDNSPCIYQWMWFISVIGSFQSLAACPCICLPCDNGRSTGLDAQWQRGHFALWVLWELFTLTVILRSARTYTTQECVQASVKTKAQFKFHGWYFSLLDNNAFMLLVICTIVGNEGIVVHALLAKASMMAFF